MATGANIREDYDISESRSGSIRVSRLVLTGWGAAPSASAGLKAWSDQGRMWGVFTASTNDFSLRRRGPGIYAGTDEICSGTVTNGKVTLAADNTSGISGTCDVDNGTPGTNPTDDSTFDVVISYCDENDLKTYFTQVTSLLDSNGKWEGQLARFERLLIDAKRILNNWIIRDMRGRMEGHLDTYGRWPLANIVEPANLLDAQALIACHIAEMNRGPIDPSRVGASQYMKDAERAYKAAPIVFDWERDLVPDERNYSGSIRIYRT